VPFWARQQHRGLNTINARAEEAATKPAFREALKRRRCLVPADAYYEWQHKSAKLKQPFAIARVNREPMAFAGLWESWLQPNGRALETFAILTIAANAKLSALHDRMPVLVEPCDYTRWLSTEVHQAPTELLRPADENTLQAWPVSARVGNIRNNDRSLLDAVDEPEQARQQSLFD
jgi:putative SOS response-associated peptidase YedK